MMNEEQKFINFEALERLSEPDKRKWGSADVDGHRASIYPKEATIKYIEEGIIQHCKPTETEQVIIPKRTLPIKETISEKIQESFALKAESKRILEKSKLVGEKEIEKGGEK